jgi:hypothetical protein
MSHRANACAGDAGRDAEDGRDRHELPTGEMARAAEDRTDEDQLDSTRPTDTVSGCEPAERPATDRRIQMASSGPADGMDQTPGDMGWRWTSQASGWRCWP